MVAGDVCAKLKFEISFEIVELSIYQRTRSKIDFVFRRSTVVPEMPKKKEIDIFKRIENVYGPIPKCIKEILRKSGFDNALVIALIDEEAIKDIESYIQENGKDIINGLDCCNSDKYKQLDVFLFMPGHRLTVLAIAQKVRELNQTAVENVMELNKVPEIADNQHQLSCASTERAQSENTVIEVSRQSKEVVDNVANGNEINACVEDELKSLLITRLEAAIKSKFNDSQTAFKIDVTRVIAMNIQMIKNKPNGSTKCVCPYCETPIQAKCHNGKWRISNIVRHIEKHIQDIMPVDKTKNDETIARAENIALSIVHDEDPKKGNEEDGQEDILREFDPLFSSQICNTNTVC